MPLIEGGDVIVASCSTAQHGTAQASVGIHASCTGFEQYKILSLIRVSLPPATLSDEYSRMISRLKKLPANLLPSLSSLLRLSNPPLCFELTPGGVAGVRILGVEWAWRQCGSFVLLCNEGRSILYFGCFTSGARSFPCENSYDNFDRCLWEYVEDEVLSDALVV